MQWQALLLAMFLGIFGQLTGIQSSDTHCPAACSWHHPDTLCMRERESPWSHDVHPRSLLMLLQRT